MEKSKRLNNAEIADALGSSASIPVEQALGVHSDAIITPLGYLALADGFNARQAQLRREREQSGEIQP